MKTFAVFVFMMSIAAMSLSAQKTDVIKTSKGDLTIHFLGHGTLMFEFNKMIIHVDPYSKIADYSKLPKANLILITHSHPDHFDPSAFNKITDTTTVMIYNQASAILGKYSGKAIVMKNGDVKTVKGLKIEAVPAYNIDQKRPDGTPFHPKGDGNGYVITFGDKRVYIAGDTENIPEMKNLKNIDIAFLPMNLPYTMTPEKVVEAVNLFHPKILYPYHTGDTDVKKLSDLMKNVKGTELRIRDMK